MDPLNLNSNLNEFKEYLSKLNISSPFTRSVAISIFKRIHPTNTFNKKLIYACISLSCKITEYPIQNIDENLELKIAEEINFEFEPFNVYAFIKSIIGEGESLLRLEEEIENEDAIFDKERSIKIAMKFIGNEEKCVYFID